MVNAALQDVPVKAMEVTQDAMGQISGFLSNYPEAIQSATSTASSAFGSLAAFAQASYQRAAEAARASGAEMSAEGEKAFRRYQALAVAQTVVDTYASAQAAYRSMVGIPLVGPGLAVAAAAAATLAGLANISAIRSAQPGGGGGGRKGAGSSASSSPRQNSSVAAGLAIGTGGGGYAGASSRSGAPVVNVGGPTVTPAPVSVEIHADPRGLYSIVKTGEGQVQRRRGAGSSL